jgi:addiction module HigA family antidote
MTTPHPGIVIKDEMKRLNLRPKEVAFRTGITLGNLYSILSGHKKITKFTARSFCLALGKTPSYWLGLQYAYDLYIFKCLED